MKVIKNLLSFITYLVISSQFIFPQLDTVRHKGPSQGSVNNGAIQTTDNYPLNMQSQPEEKTELMSFINRIPPNHNASPIPFNNPEIPECVYIEDLNTDAKNGSNLVDGHGVLLNSFPGYYMTNVIPPDPTIAVGPDHIIVCINSRFKIFDKQGNVLKNIPAHSWFIPVSPFEYGDPQIIYDHFAGRWVMVWLEVDFTTIVAGNLIAYSDDDNPLGTWYLYSTKKDSQQTNTWGDYPKLGFDDEALYITTNEYGFGGGEYGTKIRVINKNELYSSNGGPLTWIDFWEIETPGLYAGGQLLYTIVPSYSYTPGQGGYFFWADYSGNNFYALYRILNPTSNNPRLRGKIIPVQNYGWTPDANQLGGGWPPLEADGSMCKNSPIVKDEKLYMAHSTANSTNNSYASVKYVVLDLNTVTIEEQAEFGAEGYFYIYPALTVDKNNNIAVTFTRSADTEYAGAYFSTKQAGDPPGLCPSQSFAEGQGNYVVDFGSGRNRWGDYMGIYLDPENELDVWMFTEYVASVNIWGTYVAKVRMEPYTGIYSYISPKILDFGNIEVGTSSELMSIVVSNYGEDDLLISIIADPVGPFTLESNFNFPITLHTYDSIEVKIKFTPSIAGDYDEILTVTTNDPNFTSSHIVGHAYEILEAFTDLFYASTGAVNNGDMLKINKETGSGSTLGNSLFNEVKRLTVNPTNNFIYGLVSTSVNSQIVRVNAGQGDAYTLFALDVPFLTGIAFDNSGTLYVSHKDGEIYTVDLTSGNISLVTTATIQINAITFHPSTNQLWAALYKSVGSGKDLIYTINLTSGSATLIGSTNFGLMTNDLAFDETNRLFGVIGPTTSSGKLIEISTADGNGIEIGDIGFNNIAGLCYSLYGPNNLYEDKLIPSEFSLKQNYPNPFNSITVINWQLPIGDQVIIKIYDILGRELETLVDGYRMAGKYETEFNASSLPSGIYFYQLRVGSFISTKKMVLLK